MTTLIDAELARLEALAQARANAWPDATVLGSIHHSMSWFMSSVSSLVAEVRALRRHNQAMRGGNKFVRDSLQAENAALRERVEALEWLVEVMDYDFWNSKPDTVSKFTPQFGNASREYDRTYYAAREAISCHTCCLSDLSPSRIQTWLSL